MCVDFQRPVYKPIKVETKPQAVYGDRILLHKLQKVPTDLTFLLLAGCSKHLYHLDFIWIQCQVPVQDGVC